MKKRKCPKCNSDKVTKILYGLMISKMLKEYEDKHKVDAVTGGCIVWPDNPKWHCKDCENEWK
ncbi:hypothetical protein ACFLQS_00750 [Actinomycetota bacterium]